MESLPLLILIACFFIGHGLLGLFARDILWDFAQFGNAISGRTSERTSLWDRGQKVMGVVSILIGIGLLLLGWKVIEVQNARDQAEANRNTAAALNRSFSAQIPFM